MKTQHTPLWLDRVPKNRRPSYPRLRGQLTTDVVIVGGGLTGCACALSFAAAGFDVALIEADRVGAGATAGSIGLVREDFDASFHETVAAYGKRAARHLWHGQRRASLEIAAAVRRLGIKCDLAPQDVLWVARRDGDDAARLVKEYRARRDAGFVHSWTAGSALASEAAIEGGTAIRTRGFALDPYRACLGFAAAATDRRAVIFERTELRRIRASRTRVDLTTGSGTLSARAVVIATSAALPDLRALRRHLEPRRGYAVVTEPLPAAVRKQVGRRNAALRDDGSPPHVVRWLKDDRVFVVGGDQPPPAARARDKALVQRGGQLMYELSTIYPAISGTRAEWSWDFGYDDTVDGLPFIGRHRHFPRHLFALGHGRHGAAVAWLAARVLLRQFQDQPDKGDELFGFGRMG